MSDHFASPQLQAYLDGELAHDAADRVTAHCGQCETCAGELNGLRAMRTLLAESAPGEGPLRPVWPGLVHQLRGRQESPLGKAFGFATAAACAGGVAIGLILGSGGAVPAATDSSTMSTIGSLWSDGDTPSLLDIYLFADSEGEGE